MPVQAVSSLVEARTQAQVDAKKELLEKIEREAKKTKPILDDLDDLLALEEAGELERQKSLQEYKHLAVQTRDVRLDKLIQTPEGCSIFDEMCLRIDVNQRYASILPQWKDVADLLEVDQLKTLWVETCIRPREGLTRAMLEIYMKDGGTLGDLIDALIRLELFDVLGTLRTKIAAFCQKYLDDGTLVIVQQKPDLTDEKFFSVLKTLADVFGSCDPCETLQRYSGGLKNFCRDDVISQNFCRDDVFSQNIPLTTVGYVQRAPEIMANQSMPKYRSDFHQNQLKLEGRKKTGSLACKILLLFSEDGVTAADMAIDLAQNVIRQDCHIELFRLNETSLWYEMLTNPEGCCLKWSSEADYIIPILTPKYLQEIHNNRDDSDQAFIPTSPIINRYMYMLIRAQYTQAGCKNLKVRPVIPMNHLREVRTSNAVTLDPLFNHVWVPLTQEKMVGRFKGLLGEFAKKNVV